MSGLSTASTQSKRLRLQNWEYGFKDIKPTDGQIFAHWFIEINDLRYNKERSTFANIKLVDKMQKISGYTPKIEPYTAGDLAGKDLDSLILPGGYLKTHFTVTEIRSDGSRLAYSSLPNNNLFNATHKYLNFDDAIKIEDGGDSVIMTVEFAKINPDWANDSDSTFVFEYYTVIPEMTARVENKVVMTTNNETKPNEDIGHYEYRDANGWGAGDPIPSDVKVTKNWDKFPQDKTAPTVVLSLLANGLPAKHMDGSLVKSIELSAGTTIATFKDVWKFGRLNGVNTEIKYTVVEKYLNADGTTSDTHPDFEAPVYKEESNTAITITNTYKNPEPEPSPTPTTSATTSTTSATTPTTTTATTTTSATTPTTTAATITTPETTPATTAPDPGLRPSPMTPTINRTKESNDVTTKANSNKNAAQTEKSLPKTGESTLTINLAIMFVIVGTTLTIIRKKHKN